MEKYNGMFHEYIKDFKDETGFDVIIGETTYLTLFFSYVTNRLLKKQLEKMDEILNDTGAISSK